MCRYRNVDYFWQPCQPLFHNADASFRLEGRPDPTITELVAQPRAFQQVYGFWLSTLLAHRLTRKLPQSQKATLLTSLSARHF
jgi:hypothetical protein